MSFRDLKQLFFTFVNTNVEHLSDGENLNSWYLSNKGGFSKNNMNFIDGISVVCTQTTKNPVLRPFFEKWSQDSKNDLWKLIDKNKSESMIQVKDNFSSILIRMWNKFCGIFSYISFFKNMQYLNKDFKQNLKLMDFTDNEAHDISVRIAENDDFSTYNFQ